MKLSHLTFITLVLVITGCTGQSPGSSSSGTEASTPEAELSGEELEKDLRFLASDELRGRRAGTLSAEVAARYIAEQFRSAGVAEVPGAEDGYFQTVPLNNGGSSRNVIGMIEGTDPELKDEYVLLTAHYDHIGVRTPGGDNEGEAPADSIFNGARDNGMGTIAVIAAARAFAEAPPKRSVLLLAVTAEEIGLVGSGYYAENPLIPHSQVIYNLNVDTGGYSDTSIVTVVGLGRTSADSLIVQGTEPFGITPIGDPSPGEGLFDRSDNVHFARQGIPAPTFSPGFRAFSDPGVANYYHQAADEADGMDFNYLKRFAQAYIHSARLIANAGEAPHWMPGDKYEEAAKQLYGERNE